MEERENENEQIVDNLDDVDGFIGNFLVSFILLHLFFDILILI